MKFLANLYAEITLRTKGRTFCRLYNFRAYLKGIDTRFKISGDKFGYVAHSPLITQSFVQEKQGLNAYYYGLEERGKLLAQSYFIDRINFLVDDCIIECGGNVGDLSIYFRLYHPGVSLTVFEPSRTEFVSLEKNIHPWLAIQKGLHNLNGQAKFFVSEAHADSSLIPPKVYESEEIVDVIRLDSYISGPVKLLKIEAEGSEPEVLEGAFGILNLVQYICVDMGPERGPEELSTAVEVINFLTISGFDLKYFDALSCKGLFENRKLISKVTY